MARSARVVRTRKAAVLAPPPELRRLVDLWATRLGLANTWSITLAYAEKLGTRAEPLAGRASWQRNYQSATVSFARPLWEERDDRAKEHLVIHELLHLVQAKQDDTLSVYVGSDSRIYREFEQHNEALTDYLATVMQRAYSRKKRVV